MRLNVHFTNGVSPDPEEAATKTRGQAYVRTRRGAKVVGTSLAGIASVAFSTGGVGLCAFGSRLVARTRPTAVITSGVCLVTKVQICHAAGPRTKRESSATENE